MAQDKLVLVTLIVTVCLVLGWVWLQRKEELTYGGDHCGASFYNCDEVSANGVQCKTCTFNNTTADRQQYVLSDIPDYPGCKVNSVQDVLNRYPWGYTPPSSYTPYDKGWWNPDTVFKGPMRRYAGTAFQPHGWPMVNQCKAENGFKPVIVHSKDDGGNYNLFTNENECYRKEYAGYCAMTGREFNAYIDEGKNKGTINPDLIDFSLMDKLKNPDSVTFVGDILTVRGRLNC